MQSLLFYDPRSGHGEFYTTDERGMFLLTQYTGWRSSWTQIIPGRFSEHNPFTDLFFYDAAAGTGEFYTTDKRGGMHLLRQHTDLPSGRQIIPGRFGATSHLTDLLFYDGATGTLDFFATEGRGEIELLGQHTGLPSGRQIVAGQFASSPVIDFTDLLFYDAAAGIGEFYRTAGQGRISLLRQQTGWRSTWTQIIPGRFGGSNFNDLLFYDAAAGIGEFYTTDGQGGIHLLRQQSGWRSSWTKIVRGDFGGSDLTDLLFYDAAAGDLQFYATDGQGGIRRLRQLTGWRGTWAQIVPGSFGEEKRKYPLLPIPDKYRGPSGEPGQILLEGRAAQVGAFHGQGGLPFGDNEADWHVHLDLPSATRTDLVSATGVLVGAFNNDFWCEIMVNDDWSLPTVGANEFYSADVSTAFRLTKPGSAQTAWELMLQAIDNKGDGQDFSAFSTLIDGNVWLQGPFVRDTAHDDDDGGPYSEIHPLDSIAFAIDTHGKTVAALPDQADWPSGTIRWRVAWFANSHFHRINGEQYLRKPRTTTWMLPLPRGNQSLGVKVVETKIELLEVPSRTRYVSRGVPEEPKWELVSTTPPGPGHHPPRFVLKVSATMTKPDDFGGLAVRDYQITIGGGVDPNPSALGTMSGSE
jgi:hypothetical protein